MVAIGIIGTGLIATEHAKAIAMLRGSARLVAAADTVPERLREFCSAFAVRRRYQDATELLADPEVQLVAITTPPAFHEALTVSALDHDKYVFCEKPLAHSLASATRIVDAERRHPGRVAVGYQMRYDVSSRRLLWLCQNGAIGDVRSASIERHSYIPHSTTGGGWWGSWQVAGGGVLITQLIHELDLLLLIMGRPAAVSATMDTRFEPIESEDYAEISVQFSNGQSARCIASVNSGTVGGGFTIQGSRAVASLGGVTTENPVDAAIIIEQVNRALPDTCPHSRSVVSRGKRFIASRLGVKANPDFTPHARLYADILRAIESGAPLPIPPAEAMSSLELCMAAYESALAGKEITLPLNATSAVYRGISKEAYQARRCLQRTVEQTPV